MTNLQMYSISVVDDGQHYTHKYIQAQYKVHYKEQGVPVALIICWHPTKRKTINKRKALSSLQSMLY